jgi:hypothetical protein
MRQTPMGLAALLGTSLLAAGCGGKSAADGRNAAAAAPAGAAGAAAGSGGAGGTPASCSSGEARCNDAGQRELCDADGLWATTDFVCATNVAVDDEIGSYCVTKADGSFRCWGGEIESTDTLPTERYRRVQLTRTGLIGLTEDGRLLTPSSIDLPELPPIATFRATNMYGGWGICPLFTDSSFYMYIQRGDIDGSHTEVKPIDGTFDHAFCAFEGLGAGVRTDGSIWSHHGEAPAGNDFLDVTLSMGVFCAITKLGAISCFKPYSCQTTIQTAHCDAPTFPSGRYHSIAATYAAVCAIDERGALTCQRHDGVALPVEDSRYTSVDAGKNVMCALRVDGSTACFRHADTWENGDPAVAFVPVDPPIDPGW